MSKHAESFEIYAQLGPYVIVPYHVTNAPGGAKEDAVLWAMPGRWCATTDQLRAIAARNNWSLTIHQ